MSLLAAPVLILAYSVFSRPTTGKCVLWYCIVFLLYHLFVRTIHMISQTWGSVAVEDIYIGVTTY